MMYLNRRELVLVVLSEGPGRALLQQVVVVQQDPHVVEHLVEFARRRVQYKIRDYSHFFLVRNHRISVRRHLTFPTGTHTPLPPPPPPPPPPPLPPPMSKARVRYGGHGRGSGCAWSLLRILAPRPGSWCRSRRRRYTGWRESLPAVYRRAVLSFFRLCCFFPGFFFFSRASIVSASFNF